MWTSTLTLRELVEYLNAYAAEQLPVYASYDGGYPVEVNREMVLKTDFEHRLIFGGG